MRQMLGAFFQYEKTLLVAKLGGARQRIRLKDGRCEGRKPYGTRTGESEVVERMIQLRRQGLAVDKVAMALNDEGAKPRAGQQWHATSVYRILKAAEAF